MKKEELTRTKAPELRARERIENFFEVALGYSPEQAKQEAMRCLQCKNPPCVKGCPVGVDIPRFIKLIKEDKVKEAQELIKEKNNLPAICGRVCPQEDQCEAVCVLKNKKIPVNIGTLERYAADYGSVQSLQLIAKPKLRAKIAVIGSGPAGLTCAANLAKLGCRVTVFESLHLPGGVLMYGIPEFRLPKEVVWKEIGYIKSLGVEIETDVLAGRTVEIEDLFKKDFKAIFIATGAGLPKFLGIPGENLLGVYSANEFLTRINLMKAHMFPDYATPINTGKRIAVIGGGNVALDCARVALRLKKEVFLVYRRTEKEMPARAEEIQRAKEEGVIFKVLTQPLKIIADKEGNVCGLECIKMELGEPDETDRAKAIPVKDSNFILGVDTVIIAIGQNPNPLLPKLTKGLKTNANGTISVDENFMTSIPGVFAGGDIVSGADTVISAIGAGKKAAQAIDGYIKKYL